MIMKRDGRVQEFQENKITDAIFCCLERSGEGDRRTALELTLDVIQNIKKDQNTYSVEELQDLVETMLMEKGFLKTAKEYILYRDKRSRLRDSKSKMMEAVAEILYETNRNNANVGNSPSAKALQISEIASNNYYLNRTIPEKEAIAHNNGDIYIHDLSWYGKTLSCLQIPLGRLLKEGFNNGLGYIRQPKGIKSAAALAAIIVQSNQNDMHGGQSFGYFDKDLATYVELEKIRQERILKHTLKELNVTCSEAKFNKIIYERTREETYQAMEGFICNLNTMHTRAGAQTPFSSINLGTDTSDAGKMVTECFLLAFERGLGKGETPLFPNVCFKLKEDVNMEPQDPNYDLFKLSMRVACKRLLPAYSFMDSSFNKPYRDEEVAYMGCRTRVISNCNGPSVTNSRGNLSFTTINLPRIGIRAGKDLSVFWKLLDEVFDLCAEQLLTRYNVQKELKGKDFPFLIKQKLYLDSEDLSPDDKIEKAIRHGTLSVGFIGLAECLVALTGMHHGQCTESQALGISIVSHLRRRCDEYIEKHHLNFTLLATPAEHLSGQFAKADMAKFNKILGVNDKEWYTNSFHVPVEFEISALDKIAIEGAYHKYCNAGHISYIELASAPENNLEAYESLIKAMAEADMGYAAINFPVDVCSGCGHNGVIEQDYCPKCNGTDIHRVRRITGYLSTLDRFNESKLAEVKNRRIHMRF